MSDAVDGLMSLCDSRENDLDTSKGSLCDAANNAPQSEDLDCDLEEQKEEVTGLTNSETQVSNNIY